MNVLLVTLQGNLNYGNRLQNYALQKILEQSENTVTNLVYRNGNIVLKLKHMILVFLGKIGVKKYIRIYNLSRREKKFVRFNVDYIHNPIKITFDRVEDIDWSRYDIGVVGSDQVWHCWKLDNQNKNELPFFYLMFLPPSKRFSYAASFGFKSFSDENKSIHEKGLKEMEQISCREFSAVEMIKSLAGRPSRIDLDPTLLLRKNEWERIEEKPNINIYDEYMVTYFLGEITKEYRKEIIYISNKFKLDILDINDINNKSCYVFSPSEFLWVFHHAKFICTDSFHGTVFSIIFRKEFEVFRRVEPKKEEMFDRIFTLLNLLELEDRLYGNMQKNLCGKRINYDKVDLLLEDYIKESKSYIRQITKNKSKNR